MLLKENKKPVIIAIHGFGKRKTDEFNNLVNSLSDYTFIKPVLYDQTNEQDNDYKQWIKRAEDAITNALDDNEDIILLGFSMGGVIASHLASKFNVSKLILISPSFEYPILSASDIAAAKKLPKVNAEGFVEPPLHFVLTFVDVVTNCKDSIAQVSCPTLYIQASNDELIPSTVPSEYYGKMTTRNKKCIILEGGQHRILDDQHLKDTACFLIRSFIENQF